MEFEGGAPQVLKYKRKAWKPKEEIDHEAVETEKLRRELWLIHDEGEKLRHLRKHYKVENLKQNKCCRCCIRYILKKVYRLKR